MEDINALERGIKKGDMDVDEREQRDKKMRE